MPMAMITLKEYAERLGKPRNTVYRKYQNGYLKSAVKMGRDIWIDENEPYTDARVKSGKYIGWKYNGEYGKQKRRLRAAQQRKDQVE